MKQTTDRIQSLERAFCLFEILAKEPGGCTLKQLSELSGLHKSTVFRMLHTMMDCGYATQHKDDEKYYLGTKFLMLSSSILDSLDIRSIARPHLMDLCKKTGEAAHLSIRDNSFAVFIEKVENPGKSFRMYSQVGKTIPLYCSASGKVLLTGCSREHLQDIVGVGPFHKHTAHTVSDFDVLFEQIEAIDAHGYAMDWFEHEDSVFCIASPVYDSNRQVIAAISIAGTILEISPKNFTSHCMEVYQTAKAISRQIGCNAYPLPFHPTNLEWNLSLSGGNPVEQPV